MVLATSPNRGEADTASAMPLGSARESAHQPRALTDEMHSVVRHAATSPMLSEPALPYQVAIFHTRSNPDLPGPAANCPAADGLYWFVATRCTKLTHNVPPAVQASCSFVSAVGSVRFSVVDSAPATRRSRRQGKSAHQPDQPRTVGAVYRH